MRSGRAVALGAAALVLLPVLIYASSLGHPFAFDDQLNITQNPGIRVGVEHVIPQDCVHLLMTQTHHATKARQTLVSLSSRPLVFDQSSSPE